MRIKTIYEIDGEPGGYVYLWLRAAEDSEGYEHLYIGISRNANLRVERHHVINRIDVFNNNTDYIALIQCRTMEEAAIREKDYIEKYDPKYNNVQGICTRQRVVKIRGKEVLVGKRRLANAKFRRSIYKIKGGRKIRNKLILKIKKD